MSLCVSLIKPSFPRYNSKTKTTSRPFYLSLVLIVDYHIKIISNLKQTHLLGRLMMTNTTLSHPALALNNPSTMLFTPTVTNLHNFGKTLKHQVARPTATLTITSPNRLNSTSTSSTNFGVDQHDTFSILHQM